MDRLRKTVCYNFIFLFFILAMQSCQRPLFVTHWSGKGKALMKKKGFGWPNHGPLAGIVCMNELCLNKAERTNKWKKKKFKGYKNNKTIILPHEKSIPASDSLNPDEEFVLNQANVFINVQFETNSSKLIPSSYDELNKLVNYLCAQPSTKIHIVGHTDSIGQKEQNQQLSFLRAQEVAHYLILKRIAENRITYEGAGEESPVAENDTKRIEELNIQLVDNFS